MALSRRDREVELMVDRLLFALVYWLIHALHLDPSDRRPPSTHADRRRDDHEHSPRR